MELTYTLALDDYITASLAYLKESKTYQKQRNTSRILFGIIGFAAVALGIQRGVSNLVGVGLLLMGVFMLAYAVLQHKIIQSLLIRNGAKIYAERGGDKALSPTKLTLLEEGIQIEDAKMETKIKWLSIDHIQRTPSALLLFPTPLQYQIIPLRAFPSPEEADRFVQMVEDYRKAAAATS